MRRYLFLMLLAMVLTISTSFAQDTMEESKWKLSADFNMNFTQNAYSSNWAGSEQASITWVATGLFTAEKQLKPIMNWSNKLRLAYGQTHNSYRVTNENGEEETKWKKPEKSTDEVDFESIMRFTMEKYIDPYVSLRVESQFTDAENNLFNPKTISEAAGMARQFIKKENQELISRIGFAVRQHIAKDVDNTNDGGIEFVTDYKHAFPKRRMNYTSSLRIFKAVFNSDSDALDDANIEWDAPTIDWQHTFSLSLVKYLSVNLYMQMLYDKTIDDSMMLKETLGLGLTYKLM